LFSHNGVLDKNHCRSLETPFDHLSIKSFLRNNAQDLIIHYTPKVGYEKWKEIRRMSIAGKSQRALMHNSSTQVLLDIN
jgi:hypothetical protein